VNSQTGSKPKSSAVARGTPPKPSPPPPGPPLAPGNSFVVSAKLVDKTTKKPVSGLKYEVLDSRGAVRAAGQTDWQGTVFHEFPEGGSYEIKLK
jgi:hypothetical protein